MASYIAYIITNKVTGKRYIGQTTYSLKERWYSHLRKESCCTYLRNSLNKYGEECFSIKVLSYASTIEELNYREKYYIKIFNTLAPNGYNLTTGGENKKVSCVTKEKISKSLKLAWKKGKFLGKKSTKGARRKYSTKKKISNSLAGHVVSEETRYKQSIARIGKRSWNKGTKGLVKPNSGSFKKGQVAPNKGRKKVILDGKVRMIKV